MNDSQHKILRGGAMLMVGEAVVQLCGLLRNFLVAWVIAPDQFGIAAALAMSVSLVEMLSDLGAGRFLTRAHEEDGDSWLSTAHGISVIRGAVGGALLVLLAGPLAALMKMPEATWAFRVVGLVPFVRGFTHNQIWLAQRDLRFRAFIAAQAVPQVVTFVAAYPVALWMSDFRSLLWLLIANAVLSVVLSHVVSRSPYRLSYDRERFRRLLAFGLPLLGDGVLMFVVLHGERIVIANAFHPLLGAYSAAFLLAWTPSAILGRVGLSLGVPQLASLRTDRVARDRQYRAGVGMLAAPALGMAILFGFSGDDLVGAVFGADYALTAALAAWLGMGQAVRILRTFPTVVAVAEGFTLSPMVGNVARAGAVGAGWLAAIGGQPAWAVLMIGASGELVGLAISLAMNRMRLGVPISALFVPSAVIAGAFAAAWWAGTQTEAWSPLASAAGGVLLGGLGALAMLLAQPVPRSMILTFLESRQGTPPMTGAPEPALHEDQ